MQQVASREIVLLPQVEIQLSLDGLGWEPKTLLFAEEIPMKGYGRRRFGHLPQRLTDDELARDERERGVRAAEQNRPCRFVELRQTGEQPSPKRGESLGESSRVDDLRG